MKLKTLIVFREKTFLSDHFKTFGEFSLKNLQLPTSNFQPPTETNITHLNKISSMPYSRFRKIAFYEGISFLVLLLVAMPMKYFFGFPKAVTIVGSLHGILFVAFGVLALEVMRTYKKKFGWLVKAGLASLLPFGTFYMDKEWKQEEEAVK